MNYALQGKGVEITEELRSYVAKRLQNLDKFASIEARTEVELEHSTVYDGPKYRTELMYYEPGSGPVRAEARGTTLHESIDIAVGELARALSTRKKKRLHTLRRTAGRVKEYLRGWRNRL